MYVVYCRSCNGYTVEILRSLTSEIKICLRYVLASVLFSFFGSIGSIMYDDIALGSYNIAGTLDICIA